MARYVDGFVLPIPRNRQTEYQRVAETAAQVWKEHGAIEYREYVGDDLHLAGTRSFVEAVETAEDEIVVFGWVVFESREARDLANKKVATDPRMAEALESADSGFDASRMVYGGFRRLV